jgi:asparagine synthase (glutamine-hydrolysing)
MRFTGEAWYRPDRCPIEGADVCGVAGLPRWSTGYGGRAADGGSPDGQRARPSGPDDSGVWVDAAAGLALGHRRLAVIDISPAGHQPMVSRSGRTVLVYNGEIYNFRELRAELANRGITFRSGTDTEVLLEACELWGVEAATRRLVGMFAFAVWDTAQRQLKLVRDRLGIKPLYWGRVGSGFAFASELRALRQHPDFGARIDRDALAVYLRRNCVPAPLSIFEDVHKLEPGCVLTLTMAAAPIIQRYWSLEGAVRDARSAPLDQVTDREGLELVEAQLREAVGTRMVADVPLGAFLSGGVDSSTVVAMMQAQSSQPVRTFSLGSTEADHDEAPYARQVAAHLGTDHTELYVSPAEAMAVIPDLPRSSTSRSLTHRRSPPTSCRKLAREQVTVAMSGDGGDEVFAGYNRHRVAGSALNRLFDLPAPVRRGMTGRTAGGADRYLELAGGARATPRPRPTGMADNIHKLAGVLEADGPGHLHDLLASHWRDPASVVIGGREPASPFTDPSIASFLTDPVDRMVFLDTITYLPDDILTKVDRASMAVSLEARVPLLDHRLVELAWRLPPRFRIRDGVTKWALRQVLYRHVPQELIDRPKQGFGMPIGTWLRGPLREWAEELLSPSRLSQEGYFHPAPIRKLWDEHLAGRGTWQYHLWDVLMFQAWLDHDRTGTPAAPARAVRDRECGRWMTLARSSSTSRRWTCRSPSCCCRS